MVKTHNPSQQCSIRYGIVNCKRTVVQQRFRAFSSCTPATLYPFNNNSLFPSHPSPWQPLLSAFYVSVLFWVPSWDAPSVITSLHLLAQFRSATLPWLGFHKAESPTPLLRPLLSLFLDVPCISFINIHSPKWVFLPWLTFSLHKQNSTELCDSYDIGGRGWSGSRRKKAMWYKYASLQLTPESFTSSWKLALLSPSVCLWGILNCLCHHLFVLLTPSNQHV